MIIKMSKVLKDVSFFKQKADDFVLSGIAALNFRCPDSYRDSLVRSVILLGKASSREL